MQYWNDDDILLFKIRSWPHVKFGRSAPACLDLLMNPRTKGIRPYTYFTLGNALPRVKGHTINCLQYRVKFRPLIQNTDPFSWYFMTTLMMMIVVQDELGAEQDSMLETISELTDSLL